MLSGIGPGKHLAEHGIPVIADRPGVGANLQDHLELYVQYASTKPVSLAPYWSLWGKALVGAQWLFTRKGLGASNNFEACGFIRSRAGIDYPDIQFHFLPIAVRYDGKTAAQGHGFQAHVGPMRSDSRGAVTLRSANPADAPRINFNYMSAPSDWEEFRAAIRLTREIFATDPMAAYVDHEIQPGADGTIQRRARCRHPRACRKRLSPLRHGPDGAVERSHGGGRPPDARDRRQGAQACRQFGLSADPERKSQCALHHGGREGRRSYPWVAQPARREPRTLDRP
jgi:choline dehydrogenase-like flavoprotein